MAAKATVFGHEYVMLYDVVCLYVIGLWWSRRISTELIRECEVFTGYMAYVNRKDC